MRSIAHGNRRCHMNLDEVCSAGLDGEINSQELDRLLDALERDPSIRAQWTRWSAIRAAREGVRTDQVTEAWSAEVMNAIRGVSMDAAPVSAVQPVPALAGIGAPRRRRRRRWASVAVAASVLAMATGGVVAMLLQSGDSPIVTEMPAPPVTAQSSTFDRVASRQTVAESGEEQSEGWLINEYFLAHHQFAGSQTVGGTLRRAQFEAMNEGVVFDGDRR